MAELTANSERELGGAIIKPHLFNVTVTVLASFFLKDK